MHKQRTTLAFMLGLTFILGGAAVLKRSGLSLQSVDVTSAQAANLSVSAPVASQSLPGYSITWSTLDGGGGQANGGGFQVSGTFGQVDAGTSSGGSYLLQGGFWPGLTAPWQMYLPSSRK